MTSGYLFFYFHRADLLNYCSTDKNHTDLDCNRLFDNCVCCGSHAIGILRIYLGPTRWQQNRNGQRRRYSHGFTKSQERIRFRKRR